MLMFQNGLLATFIPELFMVIAFLLCLFTPGFQATDSTSEQAPIVAQVSSFERHQVLSYQLSAYDFHVKAEKNSHTELAVPPFVVKTILNSYESSFSTSDGLSYVDFSRPPPAFLS